MLRWWEKGIPAGISPKEHGAFRGSTASRHGHLPEDGDGIFDRPGLHRALLRHPPVDVLLQGDLQVSLLFLHCAGKGEEELLTWDPGSVTVPGEARPLPKALRRELGNLSPSPQGWRGRAPTWQPCSPPQGARRLHFGPIWVPNKNQTRSTGRLQAALALRAPHPFRD